jgi:hypothetical protein
MNKYKTHLVTQGFGQVPSIFNGETFSHVVKITLIWILLPI